MLFYERFKFGVATTYIILAVLIIVLNTFLLIVIISSSTLRARMSNKLVVNLTVANLIVGVFTCPFLAEAIIANEWIHGCNFHIVSTVLSEFVQNFVSSWGMVVLLVHCLCQLKNYPGPDFLNRLPALVRQAVPTMAIVFPWLATVACVLPLFLAGVRRDLWDYRFRSCLVLLREWAMNLMAFTICFLPSAINIGLVVTILILYRRRRQNAELDTRLVRKERHDRPFAHVFAAVVTVILMVPKHICWVVMSENRDFDFSMYVVINAITEVAEDLSPFLLSLLWLLLLEDVRARSKHLLGNLFFVFCKCKLQPKSSTSSSKAIGFSDIADD